MADSTEYMNEFDRYKGEDGWHRHQKKQTDPQQEQRRYGGNSNKYSTRCSHHYRNGSGTQIHGLLRMWGQGPAIQLMSAQNSLGIRTNRITSQ